MDECKSLWICLTMIKHNNAELKKHEPRYTCLHTHTHAHRERGNKAATSKVQNM